MKKFTKNISHNIKSYIKEYRQILWLPLSIASVLIFLSSLILSYLVGQEMFVNYSLNIIVTAFGMTFTITFIETRFDKIRKREDAQKDQTIRERFEELRQSNNEEYQKVISHLNQLKKSFEKSKEKFQGLPQEVEMLRRYTEELHQEVMNELNHLNRTLKQSKKLKQR